MRADLVNVFQEPGLPPFFAVRKHNSRLGQRFLQQVIQARKVPEEGDEHPADISEKVPQLKLQSCRAFI
jgi:hypothetical protein